MNAYLLLPFCKCGSKEVDSRSLANSSWVSNFFETAVVLIASAHGSNVSVVKRTLLSSKVPSQLHKG